MGVYIQLYLNFVCILISNEIFRSIDSKIIPTTIDVANQPNDTIGNNISTSTESARISFDICEYFDDNDENKELQLRGHGITVITKLFSQLWLRQVSLLSKLEVRFHNAGHKNVRFIIATQNELNAERIRNVTLTNHVSKQLEVIVVKNIRNSKLSLFEDRSTYVLDSCARIVYVIHYPFSSVLKPFVKAAILSTIFDNPCNDCRGYGEDDEVDEMTTDALESETTSMDHYILQSSVHLIPLISEGNNDQDNSVQSIHLGSEQSTESGFDEQTIVTDLPSLVDHSRNANEILKIISPLSTSILDDRSDIESSSDSSYIVPLRIILPVEHVHKSQKSNVFERYNYILLKVDDVSYHEHINSDKPDILNTLETPPEKHTDNNSEATSKATNDGNEYGTDATKSEKKHVVLVDTQGTQYDIKDHYQIGDEERIVEFDEIAVSRPKIQKYPEPKRIPIDDIKSTTSIDHDQPKSNINVDQYEGHYAKIFQWLHYHL